MVDGIRDRRIALLLAISLVGLALRLWRLTDAPGGFNQDEAVAVYDAFSVLRTGRDHHGALLPLNFRAFDDWIPPVHQYLLIPFVAILGPTVLAGRLLSAILGTSIIITTYVIFGHMCSVRVGFLASLFVAFSSWGINFSRVGLSVIILVATSTAGMMCFIMAYRKSNMKREIRLVCNVFSGGLLGLGLASYPVGKVSVSLLLIIILYLESRNYRNNSLESPISIVFGFTITSGPFLLAQILDWKTVNARFVEISALTEPRDFSRILYNYLSHFDPRLLFWSGYRDGIITSSAGFRQASICLAPFFYIGIINISRNIRRVNSQMLIGWLLIFPVASSLTQPEVPHEIRAGVGHPIVEIFSAVGFIFLLRGLFL